MEKLQQHVLKLQPKKKTIWLYPLSRKSYANSHEALATVSDVERQH